MSKKAFKYRLYPNKAQEQALQETLQRCRELYNAALQERKDAYRLQKQSITYNQQANQLPDIKELRPEKPGYPRFKSYNRFDSFTYPQVGFALNADGKHISLSKIGHIKIKLHRPIEATIKTCTIKREIDQWYAVFSCEVAEPEPLPQSNEVVGIDLGVTHFAALSNGELIDNPRHFRRAQKRLAKLQQNLARKKKGSHRRRKAKKALVKLHRKIKNQRKDFLHKQSRKLVNTYSTIVFEKLQTANITKQPEPKVDDTTGEYLPNGASAKAGLNKSILDAGWYQFQQYCTYKAERAGRAVLLVSPHYTSQICSGCGQIRKKELSERWHSCECGVELDRDHNAALNILALGRSVQASA